MSNDLTPSASDAGALNQPSPFNRMQQMSSGINAGAVAIESERAIAEARGQMQLAKMFPRSTVASIAEFMEACKSADFAAGAFYSVPNRGSGPSIRFAEEVARCYGNFEYGHRELSRSEGKSEIEVFAWDKEKNNRSTRQITVMHVVDTKNGPKRLTDQADIDNKIANVASKQIRGRILALMPKHMVMAGIAECKKTIAGTNDKPIADRVQKVIGAFSKYGVTVAHVERYLGHKVDETNADELADLIGIGNALKEGAKVADYFPSTEAADTAASITGAAKAGAAKAAAAPAAAPAAETAAPAAAAQGKQESKAKKGNSKPAEDDRHESDQKPSSRATEKDAEDGESNPPTDDNQEGDVF